MQSCYQKVALKKKSMLPLGNTQDINWYKKSPALKKYGGSENNLLIFIFFTGISLSSFNNYYSETIPLLKPSLTFDLTQNNPFRGLC